MVKTTKHNVYDPHGLVGLVDKHLKAKHPEVRPMTIDLCVGLTLDLWPEPGTCVGFGIASDAHYEALKYAFLHDDVAPEQLDAALGKGAELQKLIGPKNPYRGIVFRTTGDEKPEEPEDL